MSTPILSSHFSAATQLTIRVGDVCYKDKPWSLTKTVTCLIAHIESWDTTILQRVLDILTPYGWQTISSFSKIIISETSDIQLICPCTEDTLERSTRAFYLQTAPLLCAQGWKVIFDEAYPFRPVNDALEWYAHLEKTDASALSMDWFDLEMGIMIDGQRVNILPLIVNMLKTNSDSLSAQLAEHETVYVPMQDGQLLPVSADKIHYITQTLIELYDGDALTTEGKLRLSAWQSSQLADIEAAMESVKMRWLGADSIRSLGHRLKDFTSIDMLSEPAGLQTSLRPYQLQGLTWLQFLSKNNLNGILADDMGLGKTIQTLAHILTEFNTQNLKGPFLVIAPTSLMSNWRAETKRFAPHLKTLVIHGSDRHDLFDKIPEHDIIITTYPLLIRDKDSLLKYDYHMLILDEAQVIKNPNTMIHRIVQQLSAKHRLCLTGTPMENHLGELWSLFYFLMPGFLGDQKKFNKLFRTPIEKKNDHGRRQNLAKRIKPFMLRRTKSEVVEELPPKTEIIQHVELLPKQRALYESIRMTMHDRVRQEIREKGLKRSHIVILDALLKLRQVCCDPRLLKLPIAQNIQESAKLQLLMDIVPEMIAEKRQILLFSQFTTMLGLIEQELVKHNISYVKLTGQTKDRAQVIDVFQSGQVPLFLISLKAGGTGLNLTAADTVIHYDPWWNPAVENQATDRAYRIGQDKPVFVHKFITENTVEEKILELQKTKSSRLSGIFDERGQSDAVFTAEDLEALFDSLDDPKSYT